MDTSHQIATKLLYGRRSDGERFEIHIAIDAPRQVDSEGDEWICSMSIAPFISKRHDVHGDGSLQALCLAISAIYQQLKYFIEDGGELLYEAGETFALDASFGRSYR